MLQGLRILDLGWVLAGPFAGQLLAQLGADVIKVEPLEGDMARTIPPYFVDGESSFFLAINRGKRSVAINIKHERGARVLKDLVRRSDAVICNFTPGAASRLGVDHPSLCKLNPKICLGQLIGWHDQGEFASAPAFDLVIQAAGGVMSITGEPDGEPVRVGYQIADLAGGLYLALGTLGALVHAARTGKGRQVQVSLFDCQLALLTWQAQNYLVTGEVPRRNGSRHHMIAPSEIFTGCDGEQFVISPTGEQFFRNFCEAIGDPEMAEDKRFATSAARIKHVTELASRLQAVFSQRSTEQWLKLFEEKRIPAGPVNNVAQALHHPVATLRNMLEAVVNPASGSTHEFLGNPFKWPGAPVLGYPPRLGEHTRIVLEEVCGYEPGTIDDLARCGAVVTRDAG
jgi:crotonobetainyl-CoA:carnitine CoA-transferase CaiB-like acyl-CoA transferase